MTLSCAGRAEQQEIGTLFEPTVARGQRMHRNVVHTDSGC